jgi:hypothetical protein
MSISVHFCPVLSSSVHACPFPSLLAYSRPCVGVVDLILTPLLIQYVRIFDHIGNSTNTAMYRSSTVG